MDIILKNNTFQFNEQYFIQTSGTAMGTKVAVVYASLSLGFLEEKMYKIMDDKFGIEIGEYIRQQWKRFLDDCFIKWGNTLCKQSEITSILNSLSPQINFIIESDKTGLPFLDVFVYIEAGVLKTDIYHKPTDTFNYVPFNSCHPRGTKINVPYNLARRISLLTESTEIKEKRFTQLKTTLIEKQYPCHIIDSAISKARVQSRESLLRSKTKSYEPNMALITTHNPNKPSVTGVIKETLPILEKAGVKNKRVIFAKRQSPNLKNMLCRAKFRLN